TRRVGRRSRTIPIPTATITGGRPGRIDVEYGGPASHCYGGTMETTATVATAAAPLIPVNHTALLSKVMCGRDLRNHTSDLGTPYNRRLNGREGRIVAGMIADQPEVDNRQARQEGLMEDDFVVDRQGGPGRRLESRNEIIDRTDRGRLCHRGNRSQHFAVTGSKPGADLVKEVERVTDR